MIANVLKVYFDGKEQSEGSIVSFDTRSGTLIRYRLDEAGQKVIEDGRPAREELNGEIAVSFGPPE